MGARFSNLHAQGAVCLLSGARRAGSRASCAQPLRVGTRTYLYTARHEISIRIKVGGEQPLEASTELYKPSESFQNQPAKTLYRPSRNPVNLLEGASGSKRQRPGTLKSKGPNPLELPKSAEHLHTPTHPKTLNPKTSNRLQPPRIKPPNSYTLNPFASVPLTRMS